jgi:UDP-N-acetylglucosamine 2-epimerase (hydrolysing)
MKKRKLVFLTGTRADFGKIKPLITAAQQLSHCETHIFVTGMHMNPKYGHTVHEVKKCGFPNIYCYINGKDGDTLDEILTNTISGFAQFIRMEQPDMIIVHGDRVEALAGALVGSLNNTLVAHIEGGTYQARCK